jgi:mRNA interferase MazF
MRRGEIWWAELDLPAGQRPVVLLSRNEAYAIRAMVTVAPVTTRVRRIRSELPLDRRDGLPKPCVANLDSILTIPKATLRERISALSPQKVGALDAALRFALAL